MNFTVIHAKLMFIQRASIVRNAIGIIFLISYNISRCVSDFDHHCIWINNCVGSKNYKIFYKMIIYFAI
jgi:hypothetical protein